jgi:hypothetical protein
MIYYAGTIVYHLIMFMLFGIQKRINGLYKLTDKMVTIHQCLQEEIDGIFRIMESEKGIYRQDFDEA